MRVTAMVFLLLWASLATLLAWASTQNFVQRADEMNALTGQLVAWEMRHKQCFGAAIDDFYWAPANCMWPEEAK